MKPRRRLTRYVLDIDEQVYEDLNAIAGFISRSNPLNAERYVQRIARAMQKLTALPKAHRVVAKTRGYEIRQLLVGSHRILFKVDDEASRVDILVVIHQRQDLRNQLEVLGFPRLVRGS
jgi:toxin ParE1/3/4